MPVLPTSDTVHSKTGAVAAVEPPYE